MFTKGVSTNTKMPALGLKLMGENGRGVDMNQVSFGADFTSQPVYPVREERRRVQVDGTSWTGKPKREDRDIEYRTVSDLLNRATSVGDLYDSVDSRGNKEIQRRLGYLAQINAAGFGYLGAQMERLIQASGG